MATAETIAAPATQADPKVAAASKETVAQPAAAPAAVPPAKAQADPAQSQEQKPAVPAPARSTILTDEPAKPAEGEKAADPAKTPEPTSEIKLELPKDALLDAKDVEGTLSFAKEHGLNQKQAEAALTRQQVAVTAFRDRLVDQHDKTVNGWAKELQDDPEFGGKNFEANSALARKAVQEFFPDMVEELRATGYGNNPKFVKRLAKLGAMVSNDKAVIAQPKAENPKTPEQVLRLSVPSGS